MKIVLLLFSQFETLDAFGPAEVLGRLSRLSDRVCQCPRRDLPQRPGSAGDDGAPQRSGRRGAASSRRYGYPALGRRSELPGYPGPAGSKGAILFVGVHRFGFAGPLWPAGRQEGHLQQKILCLGKKSKGRMCVGSLRPAGWRMGSSLPLPVFPQGWIWRWGLWPSSMDGSRLWPLQRIWNTCGMKTPIGTPLPKENEKRDGGKPSLSVSNKRQKPLVRVLQGSVCTPLAYTCPLRGVKTNAQVAVFYELMREGQTDPQVR